MQNTTFIQDKIKQNRKKKSNKTKNKIKQRKQTKKQKTKHKAKNAKGIVTGKSGRFSEQVILHFPKKIREKISINDKILIKRNKTVQTQLKHIKHDGNEQNHTKRNKTYSNP